MKSIKVIKISAAGRYDEVIIPNTLASMQGYVDGYIEVAPCKRLRDVGALMIVNEEGAINGSRHNRIASRISGEPIFGNVIICGENGEHFSDVPDGVLDVVRDFAAVRASR